MRAGAWVCKAGSPAAASPAAVALAVPLPAAPALHAAARARPAAATMPAGCAWDMQPRQPAGLLHKPAAAAPLPAEACIPAAAAGVQSQRLTAAAQPLPMAPVQSLAVAAAQETAEAACSMQGHAQRYGWGGGQQWRQWRQQAGNQPTVACSHNSIGQLSSAQASCRVALAPSVELHSPSNDDSGAQRAHRLL